MLFAALFFLDIMKNDNVVVVEDGMVSYIYIGCVCVCFVLFLLLRVIISFLY